MKNSSLSETAILAGGCFWGMEELIRHRDGILATRVGYTGGDLKNPTYEQVKTGHTHHAEAIEIQFDPTRIHYDQILEFFFQIHDPTTQNRQGNDRGSQYRSAIFYRDETQKQIAEARIQAMNASHQWPGPIVTEIVKAKEFYPAEAEHQNYLQHYPNGYSCHFLRPEWHL